MLTLQIPQDFMDYYAWVLCNYLISERWDKFDGAPLAEHQMVLGLWLLLLSGAKSGEDDNKKKIKEQARNKRTNRLRERAAIGQRAAK